MQALEGPISEISLSCAYGDPCCFCCSDLAFAVSPERLFQRFTAHVWYAVSGLDGYRLCFLDSCIQLCLENLGYNIVLWMAGLTAIPDTLYEAARADGANNIQCFRYITMPNLMSTMYTIRFWHF